MLSIVIKSRFTNVKTNAYSIWCHFVWKENADALAFSQGNICFIKELAIKLVLPFDKGLELYRQFLFR